MILYGIPNCDTVKKARDWLDRAGIDYTFHDYKKNGIESAKLGRWCAAADWGTILNRAGTTFRKLSEGDRADLNEDKAIALMLAQPSMIKRPILEHERGLLVGFKPEQWAEALGKV